MIRLSDAGIQELQKSYDTGDILSAVDALDEVRGMVADEGINMPPEIRQRLMRIHQLAHRRLNDGLPLTDEQVDELSLFVDEVSMDVYQMIRCLEELAELLRPLEKMFTWEEEFVDDDE